MKTHPPGLHQHIERAARGLNASDILDLGARVTGW